MKKKKKSLSMKEVTKDYEEFEKKNEVKATTKSDFEKLLDKAVKKKCS